MKHTHETAHLTFPVEVYDIFRRSAKEFKLTLREYFAAIVNYGVFFHALAHTDNVRIMVITEKGATFITKEQMEANPILRQKPKAANLGEQ